MAADTVFSVPSVLRATFDKKFALFAKKNEEFRRQPPKPGIQMHPAVVSRSDGDKPEPCNTPDEVVRDALMHFFHNMEYYAIQHLQTVIGPHQDYGEIDVRGKLDDILSTLARTQHCSPTGSSSLHPTRFPPSSLCYHKMRSELVPEERDTRQVLAACALVHTYELMQGSAVWLPREVAARCIAGLPRLTPHSQKCVAERFHYVSCGVREPFCNIVGKDDKYLSVCAPPLSLAEEVAMADVDDPFSLDMDINPQSIPTHLMPKIVSGISAHIGRDMGKVLHGVRMVRKLFQSRGLHNGFPSNASALVNALSQVLAFCLSHASPLTPEFLHEIAWITLNTHLDSEKDCQHYLMTNVVMPLVDKILINGSSDTFGGDVHRYEHVRAMIALMTAKFDAVSRFGEEFKAMVGFTEALSDRLEQRTQQYTEYGVAVIRVFRFRNDWMKRVLQSTTGGRRMTALALQALSHFQMYHLIEEMLRSDVLPSMIPYLSVLILPVQKGAVRIFHGSSDDLNMSRATAAIDAGYLAHCNHLFRSPADEIRRVSTATVSNLASSGARLVRAIMDAGTVYPLAVQELLLHSDVTVVGNAVGILEHSLQLAAKDVHDTLLTYFVDTLGLIESLIRVFSADVIIYDEDDEISVLVRLTDLLLRVVTSSCAVKLRNYDRCKVCLQKLNKRKPFNVWSASRRRKIIPLIKNCRDIERRLFPPSGMTASMHDPPSGDPLNPFSAEVIDRNSVPSHQVSDVFSLPNPQSIISGVIACLQTCKADEWEAYVREHKLLIKAAMRPELTPLALLILKNARIHGSESQLQRSAYVAYEKKTHKNFYFKVRYVCAEPEGLLDALAEAVGLNQSNDSVRLERRLQVRAFCAHSRNAALHGRGLALALKISRFAEQQPCCDKFRFVRLEADDKLKLLQVDQNLFHPSTASYRETESYDPNAILEDTGEDGHRYLDDTFVNDTYIEITQNNITSATISDPQGCKTALHYAAETGNVELCRALIEGGASIDQIRLPSCITKTLPSDSQVHAPDKWLLQLRMHNMLREAVERGDISAHKPIGQTALHYAVANNHLDVAQFLLGAGANATIENVTYVHGDGRRKGERYLSGETPLTVAQRLSSQHMCALFQSHRASITSPVYEDWAFLQ